MEDMLHRARVAISDVSRGNASRLAVQQASIASQIGQMTTLFFAAQDEAEVFQFLADGVKSIGISNVIAALYEPEGEDLIAWSILQTPHPRYQGDRRFLTRSFPPKGLSSTDKPYSLAVAPLHISGQDRGFIAFDTGNFDAIATIVRQVEAALQGVRLIHEREEARRLAVEGRQMAEEANRLKSRFLSIVSHEIRTPLNLIFSLSDMLLRESQPVGSDSYIVDKNDLERIHIGAQHLDSLIRDVLDLAQSDVGQLKLTCEPLNLGEVFDSVSAIGKQLASGKELSWRAEIPKNLPRVWGDRTRLRQVILNLVNNAVKFTAHGEISLSAKVENGYVTVAVSDTGLGIPPNEQDVIFDEFRQSKRTTARGFGGLGLGLAICKRLVEMHGGTIGVYSSGEEGKGSRFFFSLPVMNDEGRSDKEDIALTPVQQVLLLVKDRDNAHLLENHLGEQGYKINIFQITQDDDWLAQVLKVIPDVVVIDLGLTAECGWEILKALKENPATHDIPVLFYTIESREDKGSLLEVDFLSKPVGTVELANALITQGFLHQRKNRRNNTILVIDDDPVILELHSRIIQAQFKDYSVTTASNGRDGLEIIRREKPSLVLLDLIMPELDGFGVLEAMRKEELSRDIPVIVLTGQVLTSEDMSRLNQGVASVLGKGLFNVEETLSHISAALARKRKPGSEHQRLVLRAMAYIHANYTEAITRSDIANSVGLSERHLTRCFHQELGVTSITYLNRYRVRQAKAMLEAGNKCISDVAADVGFSSGGYFARVFRDEVGVSPREYVRKRVVP
jgi:signal transduction histidine kinase/CheY-like chemotaxis protein